MNKLDLDSMDETQRYLVRLIGRRWPQIWSSFGYEFLDDISASLQYLCEAPNVGAIGEVKVNGTGYLLGVDYYVVDPDRPGLTSCATKPGDVLVWDTIATGFRLQPCDEVSISYVYDPGHEVWWLTSA